LTDGGFEAGGAGWQAFPQPGVTVNTANYTNAGAHDGASYEEANTSADAGSIYQDVPVSLAAGQSATFSAWVRLPPGVPQTGQAVNLCLWALTSSPTNACQRKTLTNTWQELQATATMATATSTLRAQFYMYGRNNIDFDGASLGAPQTADQFYAPQSTAPPAISGAPSIGSTLTCSQGSWSNAPTAFTYAWQDNGGQVSGATSATYTIVPADAGGALSCSVTASNPGGSATAPSSPVTVPVTVSLPTTPHRHGRRALNVRIIVSWTWNQAWTRLSRIRLGRLPRHTSMTITCRGRRCPRRAHAANNHRLHALLRALAGTRYHAGDRILIVLRAPGESPERVKIFVHYGRLPTAKLL
jgi:hypothetical protein